MRFHFTIEIDQLETVVIMDKILSYFEMNPQVITEFLIHVMKLKKKK